MAWVNTLFVRTFHRARRKDLLQSKDLFNVLVNCVYKSSLAYIWGAGDGGQLGSYKAVNSTPLKFPVDKEFAHIGCGSGFTVTSEKTGSKLWMCGLNTSYQCGNTFTDVILQPYEAELPVEFPETNVIQIACGRSHTMVLTDREGVFAVGGNSQGQCGIGDINTHQLKDFQKVHLTDEREKTIKIVCGLDHSLLLTNSGKVFACGWGADGQTGQGHFEDEPHICEVKGDLEGVKIKDIASSVDCCLAVSEDGQVFSWGNSEYNQLGVKTEEQQISIARKAPLLCQLGVVKHVAAAGSFCFLTTEEGIVYTWGYGVLGCGPDITLSKSPQRIKALENLNEEITQVHCGLDHAAIVTASGKLYVWGRGSFGRLGLGVTDDQWLPKQVDLPGSVQEVSCGLDHTGVILQTV